MENPDSEPSASELLARIRRIERCHTIIIWIASKLVLACAALAVFGYWKYGSKLLPQPAPAAELSVSTSNASQPAPNVSSATPTLAVPDALEVKSIAIKDGAGRMRYWVGFNEKDNFTASFFDTNGQPRLVHGLNAHGLPAESLFDQWGQARASTVLDAQGDPSQLFFDAAATPRIHTWISSDRTAGFMLMGTNRVAQYSATVDGRGEVEQEVADRKGVTRMRTAIDLDNAPLHSIYDEQHRLRIDAGVSPEGHAWHSLYDTNGTQRVTAYANHRIAGNAVFDQYGTNRFQLFGLDLTAAFAAYDEQGKLRGQIATRGGSVQQIFLDGQGKIQADTTVDKSGKR